MRGGNCRRIILFMHAGADDVTETNLATTRHSTGDYTASMV